MKHSIARRISRSVLFHLLIALAILFVGTFFLVSNVVNEQNERYGRVLASFYSDLVLNDSITKDMPLTEESMEMYRLYGNYVCTWYSVDYAYLYRADTETGEVTYLFISQSADLDVEVPENGAGMVRSFPLTDGERAVLDGKEIFAVVKSDNRFGSEIGTVLRIEDSYGNVLLAGVDISTGWINEQIADAFSLVAVIILLVLVGIYIAVRFIIRKNVSTPMRAISRSMNDYLTEGRQEVLQLPERGGVEYTMITSSFKQMTENINSYVKNIESLSRDREYRDAELDIAAKIQRGFLPNNHLLTGQYEFRTFMKPAKNVGGDLYDYFPLEGGKAALVIADVSGKGVSAAIFMAVTLMLIRQHAKMGLSPAAILQKTNDILSENNAQMLFATAFVGVYDTGTGVLTYSNAGHNPPYVIGKRLRKLDGEAGGLIGLFPGEVYPENETKLTVGNTVFLYTDGVTEATDAERHFYGEARLEQTLEHLRELHDPDPVGGVIASVEEFVGGSEQHDDITMLTFTVRERVELDLPVDKRELTAIREAILRLPIRREDQLALCVATEECFVNICSYAFPEGPKPEERIKVVLSVSDRVEIRFEDRGIPFNPLEHLIRAEDYDMETQIGGLGNLIAVEKTDGTKYEYREGKNILTFTKFAEEEHK